MDVSVIIPTFNGANKIEGALTALSQQTFQEFEVVIVVDGSIDDTLEVIKKFTTIIPNMVVHVIENGGRAHAKNEGVMIAKGSILIFIDDDIRLFADGVARHHEFHSKHKGQIAFGHLEMDPEKAKLNDFWNYRRTIESSWRAMHERTIGYDNFGITSANLSLTKEVFKRVGQFDPTLRDSEDFDFGVRALQLHIPIRYVPEIDGYHDDFSTLFPYVNRQREYLKSKYVLLSKHPEYAQLLPNHFKWNKKLSGDVIKERVFRSEIAWINLFKSRVFLALPKRIRFDCYSMYIHVHSVVKNRPI